MKNCNNEDIGNKRPTGAANRWKTPPISNAFLESPKTSLLFAAQTRAYSNKQLTQNQSSSSSIHSPIMCRTNPFEDISSLEFDTCSPGLFIVRQTNAEKGEFRWSIEDISRIMPAQIESPNSIPECYDEETENAAQEAIEKYFSFRHAVVSPPVTCEEVLSSPEMSTPPAELLMARAALACCRSSTYNSSKGMISAISSTPCARTAADRRLVIKVDESTQTRLSLPPILPPEVEAVLLPFMNNDDNFETEECNISNSTLRRKLFFNKEDVLSPVETVWGNVSFGKSSVPDNRHPSSIEWTPDEKSKNVQMHCLSSPDISPIKFNFEFKKDMSVDCSSISCHNMSETATADQPKPLLPQTNFSSPSEEIETHQHIRGIFSSTVHSSQIDQKDTGYSTMEIDSIPSTQVQSTTYNTLRTSNSCSKL